MQERVRKGGHRVPEADVRRRYTRSKVNFWTLYRPKVGRWHLLLNVEDGFVDVAAGTSTKAFVLETRHSRPFTETFRPAMVDRVTKEEIPMDVLRETMELKRIGTQSAREAQAESRRLGIPNAYARNGPLYFELPDGTIVQEDPFEEENDDGAPVD